MLDTRDIMDSSVAESVRQIEAIGSAQYQVFVTERFEKQYIPFCSNKEKHVVAVPVALHRLKPNPVTKC